MGTTYSDNLLPKNLADMFMLVSRSTTERQKGLRVGLTPISMSIGFRQRSFQV